jgi:hypothetical protein
VIAQDDSGNFTFEFILPGLLLFFATGVVGFIAIAQYVIKLREDRTSRKRVENNFA